MTNISSAMRSKRGFREDLGFCCDSKAEANVARVLKCLNIEFEPWEVHQKKINLEHLEMKNSKGDPICWMEPDFYLPNDDCFIEVKRGWSSFTENDRLRLIGALKEGKKIIEIVGPLYTILEKAFKDKVKWE